MTIIVCSPSCTHYTTKHPAQRNEFLGFILTVLASVDLAIVPGKTVSEYGGRSFDNWLTLLKSMKLMWILPRVPKVYDYGAVISARLADMGARGGGPVRLMNGVY